MSVRELLRSNATLRSRSRQAREEQDLANCFDETEVERVVASVMYRGSNYNNNGDNNNFMENNEEYEDYDDEYSKQSTGYHFGDGDGY